MSLIMVRNVHKHYTLDKADAPALIDVSLEVSPGERVCLMGPSGSGKSTLLNLIGCIDSPTSGAVVIDGEDTKGMGDARLSEFRNRRMGFIFQSFNLIPVLSVFENVEYPLLLQKMPAQKRRARVQELLARVGLSDMSRRSPENLSGGQRQRVAIARALVGKPLLVIADEPTASLDHATGSGVMELMMEMNRSEGSTLVFSTHDASVSRYAGRIVTMIDGRITEDRRAA
ncbi:MAG TPA: ABC transporter ATP-binding protein [Spirochaetia bacterium]|nr:ABC transporter ATP-binding protein [Spirochaetia bacterium]